MMPLEYGLALKKLPNAIAKLEPQKVGFPGVTPAGVPALTALLRTAPCTFSIIKSRHSANISARTTDFNQSRGNVEASKPAACASRASLSGKSSFTSKVVMAFLL